MSFLRFGPGVVLLSLAVTAHPLAAQSPAAKSSSVPTTKQPAGPNRSATAKGPLPDPALLDGSKLPVEKRPEQGMLGDFELPGDDTRSGTVGGPQQPPGQTGQGQSGGQSMGMPPMGGGGAAGQPEGQQPPPPAGGAQAGQQPGGPGAEPPQGASAGAGDPNATAEGIQVGQLKTDPSAGADAQAMPSKPQAVAIGDSAMQIKSVPGAKGAVGTAVPTSSTQQMEKNVGGGKGSTPIPGGRNAAEKGRSIPAGL